MALFVGANRQPKARVPCRDWIKVSKLFTFHLHITQSGPQFLLINTQTMANSTVYLKSDQISNGNTNHV